MAERVRRLKIYLTGWRGYFGFCETPSVLRDLDSWIRHRLRSACNGSSGRCINDVKLS